MKNNIKALSSFRVSAYIWSVIYAATIIIPLYFILISAFKPNSEIFGTPLALPKEWSFDNFIATQQYANIFGAMGKSVVITLGAEFVSILFAFPAAYAISRIHTRLAVWAEGFFGLGLLIPTFAVLLPVYLLIANLKLLYDPLALILFYPATGMPLSVLILASYLRQVPKDLEDSAMIDGASHLQTIWQIFLPLSTMILLNTQNRTVQLAVTALKAERASNYGLIAAGVVISMVPVFILFIFFQDRIVKGMMSGSIKG